MTNFILRIKKELNKEHDELKKLHNNQKMDPMQLGLNEIALSDYMVFFPFYPFN